MEQLTFLITFECRTRPGDGLQWGRIYSGKLGSGVEDGKEWKSVSKEILMQRSPTGKVWRFVA